MGKNLFFMCTGILSFSVLLAGCGGVNVQQNTSTVEVGSEDVAWDTFITIKDADQYNISYDESQVDVNTLGDYTVTYSIEKKDNKKVTTKEFTFQVEDTIAPEIKPVSENITVALEEEFDPLNFVTVTDNYDGEINADAITVENNVDVTKKGKYAIKYTATDAAGNQNAATVQVSVIDKPINLGDIVTSELHGEISLADVSFQRMIKPSNPSMFYSYYESKEDAHVYLVVSGSYKSLEETGKNLEDNLEITALYNNKYTYTGFVVGDTKGDLRIYYTVDPLETVKFKYLLDVPIEVQQSTAPLELNIQLNGAEPQKYIVR